MNISFRVSTIGLVIYAPIVLAALIGIALAVGSVAVADGAMPRGDTGAQGIQLKGSDA